MDDQPPIPKMQETDTTWDLIKELSKKETNSVMDMFLRLYDDKVIYKSTWEYLPESFFSLFQKDRFILSVSGSKSFLTSFDSEKTPLYAKSMKKTEKIIQDNLQRQCMKEIRDIEKSDFYGSYRTAIPELLLLFYVTHTSRFYATKNVKDFINAVFSFRDALLRFTEHLQNPFAVFYTEQLKYWSKLIPWKPFLEVHTRYLIRNHFKGCYMDSITPFPEQAELINMMKIDPIQLFIMPWGVGCGKTASVSPIAHILWNRHHHQTIYCVGNGPVRDQTASNLYRCGIPFAFINFVDNEFTLQPSFHCSYNAKQGEQRVPVVLISDTKFVRYYLKYWEDYKELVDDEELLDPSDNPPCIQIPNHKFRYHHLRHENTWSPRYALIIDEPNPDDQDLTWILRHLPQATYIMSATHCHLINSEVCASYETKYGRTIEIIHGNTIGVSTTMIGFWMHSEPILSPFSFVLSRADFQTQYEKVKTHVIWRRFLSPKVLLDWNERIRKPYPELKLKFDFHFEMMNYDQISFQILRWASSILEFKKEDAWYKEVFGFSHDTLKDIPRDRFLHDLLNKDAPLYASGCIVSVPSIQEFYGEIQHELDDFPELENIDREIQQKRRVILKQFQDCRSHKSKSSSAAAKKARQGHTNRDIVHEKEDALIEAFKRMDLSMPIEEHCIINTSSFCQRLPSSTTPSIRYVLPLPLLSYGDPQLDGENWKLSSNKILGVNDTTQRFRWKGVGSIVDHKEFYMKCIVDNDTNHLAFLVVDMLGSFGLNLKISNAILMEGKERDILPSSVLLQVAGRVGRIGQDSSGKIIITSKEIFDKLVQSS